MVGVSMRSGLKPSASTQNPYQGTAATTADRPPTPRAHTTLPSRAKTTRNALLELNPPSPWKRTV